MINSFEPWKPAEKIRHDGRIVHRTRIPALGTLSQNGVFGNNGEVSGKLTLREPREIAFQLDALAI
jgi:hypothetical protein